MRLQPVTLERRAATALPCDAETLRPLPDRLAQCAARVLALHTEDTQLITISPSVTQSGLLSSRREAVLLQIAEAMLADILTHAMHRRLQGRITVALATSTGGCSLLTVTHDGWNLEAPPMAGWLQGVQAMVAAEAGSLAMGRAGHSTITLLLPWENPYRLRGH